MGLSALFSACVLRACARCGAGSFSALCADCARLPALAKSTPQGLRAHALGAYLGPTGELTRELKYQERTIVAAHLGRALYLALDWSGELATIDALVPVPLHPVRLAARGYNQSALLARHLGYAQNISVQTGVLRRVLHTQAQATLKGAERATNLSGAFLAQASVAGQRIALVDDVVTTGHTLDACKSALEQAGAVVVCALACAMGGKDALAL